MTGSPVSGLPTPASARAWLGPTASSASTGGTTATGGSSTSTATASASTAPSVDPAEVAAQAAHTAGVTPSSVRNAFTSFLSGKTSTAAFWGVSGSRPAAGTLPSPALAGVTFDADGFPDFSAIIKAGGKVTGALPPDGQSVFSVSCDGRRTVQYAVEIDRGDGSPPIYLKGVNVNGQPSVDRAGRADALKCAAKMFADMADSLEEVRVRCWAGRSSWTAPQRSIDITA